MKLVKSIIIVSAAVQLIFFGCKLPRDNINDPLSPANDDGKSPAIVSITPAGGAADVSSDTSIVVTFSETMDRTSVEAAFSLAGTGSVSGTFSWAVADTVMTFTPDDLLAYYQNHSVVISSDSADAFGNKLATDWSGDFTSSGAAGRLDTDFNGQGYVLHHNAAGGNGTDSGNDIVIDNNGKLVITGHSDNAAGNKDMVIWRYNSNGSLDTTFNSPNGYVVHDNAAGGGGDDYGNGIAIDTDGNIVVCGYSFNASGDEDMVIWRYNSSGSLDTTFNSPNGYAVHGNAAGGNGADIGNDIAANNTGKIIVTGESMNDTPGVFRDMVIWQYNSDGTLDTGGFNSPEGYTLFNSVGGAGGSGEYRDYGYDITLSSSGKILVAGKNYTYVPDPDEEDMMLWRYDTDGGLDDSFNGQGWATHDNAAGGNGFDLAYGVAIDRDSRILVTGNSHSGASYDMATWRYNSNGTIDTTFNGQGWVTHHDAAGGNGYDTGGIVSDDSGGKIVVAGKSISEDYDEDIAIWRYNHDGSLDTSFGAVDNKCGWVTHNSAAGGNSSESANGMVFDSDGKIVLVGSSKNASGNSDMVIWRYE